MTDRFNALIVVLDENIRVDDAQVIINAISMIKRVVSVKGNVSDFGSHIAEERARIDLVNKIAQILQPFP